LKPPEDEKAGGLLSSTLSGEKEVHQNQRRKEGQRLERPMRGRGREKVGRHLQQKKGDYLQTEIEGVTAELRSAEELGC